MTLRGFILAMMLGTLVCWAAFCIVIFNSNPYEAGMTGFIFFYSSLTLSLIGTITIIGLFVRLIILNRYDFVARRVSSSFRQAVFLSLIISGTLYLTSKNLLTWWNIGFFVIGISLFEFFFISLKRLK
jgi:hypothetical protein